MKHNIIKTDNYLLVVDDSEIKEDDLIYDLDIKRIVKADGPKVATSKKSQCWYYKKIISHRPLNGAPYLDGVDVLSSLEDDVDSICIKDLQDFFGTDIHLTQKGEEYLSNFKTGYNKAREKFLYTEEDMLQAAKYGYEFRDKTSFPEHKFEDSCINNTKQWLQSLQQHKYPIAFECEMELVYYPANWSKEGEERLPYRPKTFINSQGRIEWVGKYIY